MREAFVSELEVLALADKRIVLLAGDLGYKMFDRLLAACPNQFLNVGISEQAMIGVACGLALSGRKPITYTIGAFNLRAFEQIRIACYHDAPIIVAGIGCGMSYYALGPTHHCLEDLSTIRSLPNMAVVCPSDAWEVRASLREALKRNSPTYLRLGKKGEPILRGSYPSGFEIGKAIILREGRDVAIISCGPIVAEALGAADALDECGVSASVISNHSIKPMDERMLREAFSRFRLVVSVEEHSLIGGLGSAVAEWAMDHRQTTPLLRLGSPDAFFKTAGERHYILNELGLTAKHIAQRIMVALPNENASRCPHRA